MSWNCLSKRRTLAGDLELLRRANIQLEKLRYLIRLSHDFSLFSTKQYEYISGEINEVGKRIGGWIKQHEKGTS